MPSVRASRYSSREGFCIGSGDIFGPAQIMQGGMLRSYRSIVQAGGDGVGQGDLPGIILQHVGIGTLQHAGAATTEARGVVA